KSQFGVVHDQDGPLWLGSRLMSSRDPSGYEILTYDKGGYVLYMLRQMMWDTSHKDPDEAFKAMMHDFTSTYADQDASTADFQKMVEKHMLPVFDIDHPEGWHGLLPVYIWQGKHFIHGQVPVVEAHETVAVPMGFKPDKIVANQFLDMLVEVDQ